MNGLSVIIPIYNVEKYIDHCLQSVVKSMMVFLIFKLYLWMMDQKIYLEKSLKDLLINMLIFTMYLKKMVVYQMLGIMDFNLLQYDYVTFLDSDDYLDENYFSEIFEALKDQPDMIIFDWMDVGEDGYHKYCKRNGFS